MNMVDYMEIRELKANEEDEWDRYVLKSKESTFYHQIGWKNVIEKTYDYKSYYFIAEDKGDIKGVFPLFLINSKIFGRKLVSIPFAPYGGICAENSKVENELVENAKFIAKEKNVDYLEIRSKINMKGNFEKNDQYYTLILKLEKDPELVWNNFNRKVRNAVRKGIKSNLECEIGTDKCKDFYYIYSQNMRNLGTPVHKYSFFSNLLTEFPEQTKIATVMFENKVIASIFLLSFKDTIISGWASSDKSYLELSPNNFIYWECIKSGCEHGYKYFDFGKSIFGSGTYHFKIPWGTEPYQLHYLYCLYNSRTVPNVSQENENRKLFANLYKKLPLQLTNLVGPKLRKEFP